MNKTVRYVIYAMVITLCIASLFIGIATEALKKTNVAPDTNIVAENDIDPILTKNKDAFKDLFTNRFWGTDYTGEVNKADETKDIVYTAITAKQAEGKYSIDINIPIININSEVVNGFNAKTSEIFVAKANDVIQNSKVTTFYSVTYTAYINNDILSVAIMCTLKEGTAPQRVMVQTYNYDLANDKEILIDDILNNRGLDTTVVNKKIKTLISQAAADAESMQDSGYDIYKRNIDSNIYKITNVKTFIQGPNGELFVVYAYGNTEVTSEMDVIEI